MRYLPDSEEVEFTVDIPDKAWFGLVLGQGNMSVGNDMVVFAADIEADGASGFGDYRSIGYAPPQKDEIENLQGETKFNNDAETGETSVTFTARRKLDTGDAEEDFVIPLDEEFTLGYAYNPESSELSFFNKHEIAGSVVITLPSDGSPVWGEPVVAEPVNNVSAT